MLEEISLSIEILLCTHSPKVIRYTVNRGLNEIGIVILCQACRILSSPKFVIKAEVIENE
jgi:hypothetical protein